MFGAWTLFKQSQHLLFDGVPDGVDPSEVQELLESLPGVNRVHDQHEAAMGSAEIALTLHRVLPDEPDEDANLQDATQRQPERFDIDHVTHQAARVPFPAPCAPPDPGRTA